MLSRRMTMDPHPLVQTVRDHTAGLPSDPLKDPGSSLCTTIQLPDDSWIRFAGGHLSLRHLDDDSKEERLEQALLASGSPVDIERGLYATCAIDAMEPSALDELLSRLLRDYYEVPDDAEVPEIFSEEL